MCDLKIHHKQTPVYDSLRTLQEQCKTSHGSAITVALTMNISFLWFIELF